MSSFDEGDVALLPDRFDEHRSVGPGQPREVVRVRGEHDTSTGFGGDGDHMRIDELRATGTAVPLGEHDVDLR